MGLFSKTQTTSELPVKETDVESSATSAQPSKGPSINDLSDDTREASNMTEKGADGADGLTKAKSNAVSEDYETVNHVTGLKLAVIVTGLCLSVLLVALVSLSAPTYKLTMRRSISNIARHVRTTPLLLPPFPRSLISSMRSKILAGTEVRICSLSVPFS